MTVSRARVTGHLLLAAIAVTSLVACQSTGARLQVPTIEERDIRTRSFDGVSEPLVFGACLASLQDLGFQVDEAEQSLGAMVGSKRRDTSGWQDVATNTAILSGLVLLSVATQTDWTSLGGVSVDDEQIIRVSLIAWPSTHRDDSTWRVRATFQRTILDKQGKETTLETLDDPELYQALFTRLSHSLYLERQEVR